MIHGRKLNGMHPIRQWDLSALPRRSERCDHSHMANAAPNALAAAILARMEEQGIGQKALALKAGLNETYVRDILKARSRHPHAAKLAMIADALGCRASDLLDAAAPPELRELVSDPAELLLLATWRKLAQKERESVLEYIAFRLSRSTDKPEPAAPPTP